MKAEEIEFKDFPKAISTIEFVAVLEVIKGLNENFEKALEKRDRRHRESEEKLERITKENGKYSKDVLNARKVHRALVKVTNEDIASGWKMFLNNYDGIIEFLTRFSLCDSVKVIDIKPFLQIEKNNKKK